jgi:pyruvate dehydrogenase E2 component (dihydrolipoamide acetyltransferase)
MEKGNIKTWGKQVGDEVVPGDVLASIETDKAVVDFEMQEEGYIAKLLYPEGAKDVALMETIAILVENKEDIAAFANYSGESEAPAQAEPVAQSTPEPVAAA